VVAESLCLAFERLGQREHANISPMRAARVHAWGADPAVDDAPEPEAGAGETLVAVAAAAIAHIDLTVASGEFAHRPPLPYVPGTEGAGMVVASARFGPGTSVRIRGEGVGLWRDGTCAALAAVPDGALFAVPAEADLRLAAAFLSPCLTAHVALHDVGGLAPGERVLVTGASGAVASVAVQLALRAGAEVVAVSRDPERARGALPAGAAVVAPDDLDAAGAPFDLLLDTVGGPLLPGLVLRRVRPGGRAVLVGYAAGEEATFALPLLMAADVRLLPMNLIRRGAGRERAAGELLAALTRGDLTLATTVVGLDELPSALAMIRDGTAAGRVVVDLA
jgi:NADPH:quinone reductase-like Zn-dependent oxidoreductase